MAGYDRREGWRERDSSIFRNDDDDRWDRGRAGWSGDRGHGSDDERGFFERAGDEVRSWFGDDDAIRRRERDMQRGDARAAFGGRDFEPRDDRDDSGSFASRTPYGGYGFDYGPVTAMGREGRLNARDYDHGASRAIRSGGRLPWEDNYLAWRREQIDQLDRDYAEFCQERQHQFDRDFDGWRRSRLTEGGTGPASATAETPDGATGRATQPIVDSTATTRTRTGRARS